jgi:hypothetical protein
MELSKKLRMALVLALAFSASFTAAYLALFLTQTGHSTPASYLSTINGMDLGLGPPPNATNVPLDTAITVEAVASAALNNLHLMPEVPIARVYSEATSSLTYLNTFYPAELLQPATAYNVSVTFLGTPVSWAFTTTSEPYHPSLNYYLATNMVWISLAAAALTTAVVGLAVWFKFRQVLGES